MTLPASPLSPGSALRALRERRPLVQCITNAVVTGFTANALLALGASPAMVDLPGEAGPFSAVADAVLVNLGTPTAEQRDAAREAVAGRPRWVLDPVAVGVLPLRTRLAEELLRARPTIIRGNASEILAVATGVKAGRGVDADGATAEMTGVAASLALSTRAVVAVTGAIDHVSDGTRTFAIANGHPLLARITGSGCTATALVGAFLGAGLPALDATAAALVLSGVACERAARGEPGPGTFQVRFLDALASISPKELAAGAKISRA